MQTPQWPISKHCLAIIIIKQTDIFSSLVLIIIRNIHILVKDQNVMQTRYDICHYRTHKTCPPSRPRIHGTKNPDQWPVFDHWSFSILTTVWTSCLVLQLLCNYPWNDIPKHVNNFCSGYLCWGSLPGNDWITFNSHPYIHWAVCSQCTSSWKPTANRGMCFSGDHLKTHTKLTVHNHKVFAINNDSTKLYLKNLLVRNSLLKWRSCEPKTAHMYLTNHETCLCTVIILNKSNKKYLADSLY